MKHTSTAVTRKATSVKEETEAIFRFRRGHCKLNHRELRTGFHPDALCDSIKTQETVLYYHTGNPFQGATRTRGGIEKRDGDFHE